MSDYLDENTFYLQEQEWEQGMLEKRYLNSLPQVKEAILEFSSSILKQDVDGDTFHQAFSTYWDSDKEEYDLFVLGALADWYENILDADSLPVIRNLARLSLEAAAEIMEGESVYFLASEGNWNIAKMVEEVVGTQTS